MRDSGGINCWGDNGYGQLGNNVTGDSLIPVDVLGIFDAVSVSAGNLFDSYNTTGLSYPAVSQFVVPVASVDNDGSLSYFSQRHDRVLAAPGSSITSTVPDYLFGSDGVADDFGTASGTSSPW